jgi:hypothetical protein
VSDEIYDNAIKKAMIFCPGCAKKETVVMPKRSSVIGLAAVHSSGMICIPWTILALVAEAENGRGQGGPRSEQGQVKED